MRDFHGPVGKNFTLIRSNYIDQGFNLCIGKYFEPKELVNDSGHVSNQTNPDSASRGPSISLVFIAPPSQASNDLIGPFHRPMKIV